MSGKTVFNIFLSLVAGCTSAFAQAPSFDCFNATYPDERAICSNAELSQLDIVANAGFEYVRRVHGHQYANSITVPLLHARQGCGSDIACIKQQILAAIQKYQSLGAPNNGQPATQSPSFDCSKARANVERAICGDPELAQLDNSLARVFNLRYSQLGDDQRRALLEEERRWVSARIGQCDVGGFYLPAKPCILQMIKARIAVLEAVGGPTTSPPRPTQQMTGTPFVVSIETSVSGGARPIITGTTNLPDGMKLAILLRKPWLPNAKERLAVGLPACDSSLFASHDCAPLTTNTGMADYVFVKNGQFSDGPFTNGGDALSPGAYVLEVMADFVADGQRPDVLGIIGSHGENMTGPLAGGCCFGPGFDQAEIQKTKQRNNSDAAILGASIYYARYVEIEPPSYQPLEHNGQNYIQQPLRSSGTESTFDRPSAQETDPYAEGAHRMELNKWRQDFSNFLENYRGLMFAVACKVIPQEVFVTATITGPYGVLYERAVRLGVQRSATWEEVKKARNEGLQYAAEKGCSYWQEHLEEAYALRNAYKGY